ncbi:hypothetical protein [Hymenobacter rubripertinctus]|uniref:Uncharacterized protein n=1 Tax=Hymenobacter rubripertinctus TaxID=2029981 RepID=A0A418QLM0_9BACT|nr:hypothetical protein [Hymenobacter rubripertinctus]RIY06051.1 hypothetical protein D0T11_19625 [Hymenobacter rubripertinctus]
MTLLRKRLPNESSAQSAAQMHAAVERFATANPNAEASHFFSKQQLTKLLDQPNCVGIRVYLGLDEQQQPQLVAVGTDALLSDMLRGHVVATSPATATTSGGRLMDKPQAAQWTANHRRSVAGQDAFFGFLFEEHSLATLLDDECQGMRLHYAIDEQERLVVVPSRIEKAAPAPIELLSLDFPPCPPCCSPEDWWTLLGFSLNQDGPRRQKLRVSTASRTKQTV